VIVCPYAAEFLWRQSILAITLDLIESSRSGLAKVVDFPAIGGESSGSIQEVGSNCLLWCGWYPTDGTLLTAKLHRGLCQIAQQAVCINCQNTPWFEWLLSRESSQQVPNLMAAMLNADQVIIAYEWLHGKRIWQNSNVVHSYSLRDDRKRRTVLSQLVRSVSPKLRAHGGNGGDWVRIIDLADGKRILFWPAELGKGQPQLYSK